MSLVIVELLHVELFAQMGIRDIVCLEAKMLPPCSRCEELSLLIAEHESQAKSAVAALENADFWSGKVQAKEMCLLFLICNYVARRSFRPVSHAVRSCLLVGCLAVLLFI